MSDYLQRLVISFLLTILHSEVVGYKLIIIIWHMSLKVTLAEPEFRICWMKLYSSDNHDATYILHQTM